ncbi:hypothetical protein CK203_105649 [Vitis vinifera]|uniref:A20-type domain-containing protein n=1 Tax=Vitis vinifera TaxID=29760 RepID=A0A438CH59_VITVI|nr:hypothetical protein CK203_105649 [Vitis vinifera]
MDVASLGQCHSNLCSKCYRDFLKKEESTKAKAMSMKKAMGPRVESTSSLDDVATSMAQLSLSMDNTKKTSNGDPSTKMKRSNARCHECNFDYKAIGREILRKQNPSLKPEKLSGRL